MPAGSSLYTADDKNDRLQTSDRYFRSFGTGFASGYSFLFPKDFIQGAAESIV